MQPAVGRFRRSAAAGIWGDEGAESLSIGNTRCAEALSGSGLIGAIVAK
jgi:hypothetical protein